MRDLADLAIKIILNTTINRVKGEQVPTNNLAPTSAFTAVENKTPYVSNIVKKTEYNKK